MAHPLIMQVCFCDCGVDTAVVMFMLGVLL